jgi:hypothetical protein
MSIAPSSKRVYRNFPGPNGFNYMNDSEWVDIGLDVYQSNTRGTGILLEPDNFKSYIQRYVRSACRSSVRTRPEETHTFYIRDPDVKDVMEQ